MASNILIVEDDHDISKYLSMILTSEGYKVTCAENGQEALDFLNQVRALPCLILLDLMMPVMDGLKFREAQTEDSRLSKIPVVVMTAGNQEKRTQIQVEAFIQKPLDLDQLLVTIERFC